MKCRVLYRYSKELDLQNKPHQDPFTNKPFDSDYKPFIDESLKSKIDRFFFDNKDAIIENSRIKDKQIAPESCKKRKAECLAVNNFDKKAKNDRECDCCKNKKTSMYLIEDCQHSYCRECLKVLNSYCLKCKKKFEKSSVVNADRVEFLNKI